MSHVRATITFTCDRSGVGQSMALASIALMLAANGRRVLAIDWDFAKPSLAKYLIPFVPADGLESNDGVIDTLWSYATEVRRVPPKHFADLHRRFAAVSPIECAIPDELRMRYGGALHLLPAGREPRRRLRVRYFCWGEFFDRLDGESLLTTLWKELERRYDHILIDCPQISNATRFPILNACILVTCFTLDRESMEAGAALARWATERLPDPRLLICPFALRVEHAELALLHRARERRDRSFQQFEESALFPMDAHVRTALEVPETPFYAYQRVLPPLVSIGNVIEGYRLLAGALAGQQNIEWRVIDERQAATYRAAYETAAERFLEHQVQPLLPPYSGHEEYAFVSYARDDRDEVVPLLQELLDLGWRLWWDEEIPGGSQWQSYLYRQLYKATHVVLFLSARSVRSKWMAEEIRLAQKLGKPFLSIRLDWSEVPEESLCILSRYQMLDKAATDFRKQLIRGMQLLHASSNGT